MPGSRSSVASDSNQRLEPKLLKAAENDDTATLRMIIQEARRNGQMSDKFLAIGLMRSSEKGQTEATRYLLGEGAKADMVAPNGSSPLLRAVEHNHVGIVQILLDYGASTETVDKKGRTALMMAAWKNYWHMLHLLLRGGADVNAKDLKERNVLHNLAADKQCDWGEDVVDLLLMTDIRIDSQDNHGRSPLHWACATAGKKRFAEKLLSRPRGRRADVDAVEMRMKTPLHIAAAHDRDDMVELLLGHHADVSARSDGGWTALHNACDKGSLKIVRVLLKAGAEVNRKLIDGRTPLHLAAQGGHIATVKCLLECKGVKRTTRDALGSTPLLSAAQSRCQDIVQLLAPSNHVDALSEDALGACNGFNATIVDFGNYHNENQVKKRTIYELLYGRDPKNPGQHAINALPRDVKATRFRWIHLPANNMAWVEALLTKAFIEEGASDVEGFKALEKSFNHQHQGQRIHSHFMRPLCHRTPRAPRHEEDDEDDGTTASMTPSIFADRMAREILTPDTPVNIARNKRNRSKGAARHPDDQINGSITEARDNKGPKRGMDAPKSEQSRKGGLRSAKTTTVASSGPPSWKDSVHSARGNVYAFMPYLHFETDRRRQEMQDAIRRAEDSRPHSTLSKAWTDDELLVRAHLKASNASLHIRRTLDQSFYHNIDTQIRDSDQVIYRYQTKGRDRTDAGIDPKILMVDQLWTWILGRDLIVTSFPQRWQQPKNDPLNVLDNIIEEINSRFKMREPVRSVYDLAAIITGRCTGAFDRDRIGDDNYQFLDMFESSIGNATDRESTLFSEFNNASVQASEWLRHHRRPNRFSRNLESSSRNSESMAREEDKLILENINRQPLFVDRLLDIGQETELLAETKDIRDELNMIKIVLENQKQVIPDLEVAICDIYKEERRPHQEVKKRFKEQQKLIEMRVKDIDRMDEQAVRICHSITDLLDLKQKHANAFEARFTRDQAADTARQGQTIMVFTIVTIIFLPLSFIATFFAINIQEFPRSADGSQNLHLAYVTKYMFGISFAISIPLVFIALSLDNIGNLFREAIGRVRWRGPRSTKQPSEGGDAEDALELLVIEQTLSVTKSARSSVETNWIGGLLPVARKGARESESSKTPR